MQSTPEIDIDDDFVCSPRAQNVPIFRYLWGSLVRSASVILSYDLRGPLSFTGRRPAAFWGRVMGPYPGGGVNAVGQSAHNSSSGALFNFELRELLVFTVMNKRDARCC